MRSYRLDQRDEADVRYWLGDDFRGEVGVQSGAGSLGKRVIYEPIQNFRPFRYVESDDYGRMTWHGTVDVGLRCGPIVVKPKKPPYVPFDTSRRMERASERDSFLESIWRLVNAGHQSTLEACYGQHRLLPAFEVFRDLAPLVCDTRGALICEQRERTHCGTAISRYEAMMEFAGRILSALNTQGEMRPSDRALFLEIEIEADQRLSIACRAYTEIADEAYRTRNKDESANA